MKINTKVLNWKRTNSSWQIKIFHENKDIRPMSTFLLHSIKNVTYTSWLPSDLILDWRTKVIHLQILSLEMLVEVFKIRPFSLFDVQYLFGNVEAESSAMIIETRYSEGIFSKLIDHSKKNHTPLFYDQFPQMSHIK